MLLEDGEPVGLLFWAHDYGDRTATGWFLALLDERGEERADEPQRRLDVAPEVDGLVRDEALDPAGWLAATETLELVTAPVALAAAELVLADALG
ncbi:MAG TPA: hypothetical protein VEX67_18315 [Solirubrobacteraceae bacterium]|nr:hypothetical protein [Solirubrobacteraceae bacterium]